MFHSPRLNKLLNPIQRTFFNGADADFFIFFIVYFSIELTQAQVVTTIKGIDK